MWKYQSDDVNNISLHDHLIDGLTIQDNDISLIFKNGFDVVKTHPLNSTGRSKRTGKSQIILNRAKLLRGTISPFRGERREISLSALISKVFGFEILEFKVEDKLFSLSGILHEKPDSLFDSAELTFCCDEIMFYWNEYIDDAWFEDGLT